MSHQSSRTKGHAAQETSSRQHLQQFYGGIALGIGQGGNLVLGGRGSASAEALSSAQSWRREQRTSKFLQERQRGKKRKAFSSVDSIVDAAELVEGTWYCTYCDIEVVINNRTNWVKCPQCQAKHLEAPQHPTEGLLLAR